MLFNSMVLKTHMAAKTTNQIMSQNNFHKQSITISFVDCFVTQFVGVNYKVAEINQFCLFRSRHVSQTANSTTYQQQG
jgi:hypothetical protein